jgi:hypothetical protein
LPSEQVAAAPYPLLEGVSPIVGWQYRPPAKGGSYFVILRRTGLGSCHLPGSWDQGVATT